MIRVTQNLGRCAFENPTIQLDCIFTEFSLDSRQISDKFSGATKLPSARLISSDDSVEGVPRSIRESDIETSRI